MARLALSLVALFLAGNTALAEGTVGSVIGGFAEVANQVSGALPGKSAEAKQPKSPAHFGEHVVTASGARANISFIDGSHLLIGEKAELTIDDFVFDPKSGTELATYKLAAGALRLISGGIKGDKLKIQTPTAAIVVRGTNLKLKVTPDGATIVAVNRGSVEITSRRTFATATLGAGQSVTADQQGLGDVQSSEVEVDDGFVDDAALDGNPDLADVSLSDLGFSDAEAADIESGLSDTAEGDNADGSDSGSGSNASESDGGDSGGSDSGAGDSGGDSGGGEGGGGGDN